MGNQTRPFKLGIAIVLATLVVACGSDDTTPSPIAPTPPPTAPAAIYTLSGVVFEVTSAGNIPVEGVTVYCDPCGPPEGHSFRSTGADGVYSFDGAGGVGVGSTMLFLSKRGTCCLINRTSQAPTATVLWEA